MAEHDNTADFTMDEKLDRILSELTDLKDWRAKVDAFIEDRSRDTRPKLDLIHKEVADVRADVSDIRRELRLLRDDLLTDRKERVILSERIDVLENRPN